MLVRAVQTLGAVAVVVGVALMHRPAAWIVGGVLTVLVAEGWDR